MFNRAEIRWNKKSLSVVARNSVVVVLTPVYSDTTQLNSTRRRVELSCVAINGALVVVVVVAAAAAAEMSSSLPLKLLFPSLTSRFFFGFMRFLSFRPLVLLYTCYKRFRRLVVSSTFDCVVQSAL